MHAGALGRQGETDDPQPPPSDYVRTFRVRDVTVLELRGEIDLAALPEVELYVDEATRGRQPRVVIDLRPVDFLDCSGLRALVHARQRVGERDGDLRLVCGRPLTLRILRAAGLLDAFRPVSDLEEALGG